MLKQLLPTTEIKDAYQGLLDSFNQYQEIKQRELTNREAIRANRDIELARIKGQKELLELYLREIFKERRAMLDHMFKSLDKGLETGNMDIIGASLHSILSIAKESPLTQARQIMVDMKNPDIKSIDW